MLSSPLDAIIPCSHAPFLVSRYMRAHWDNSIHPFSPGAKDHRVALRTAFEGISAESKAHYQVLAYSRHTHETNTSSAASQASSRKLECLELGNHHTTTKTATVESMD